LTRTGWWIDKVAISDRGQVVGEVNAQAFLYEEGKLIGVTTKHSEAVGINEHGQVVGWVLNPLLAVLWQRGQVRELGTLGGAFSEPMAINERGQVVGRSGTRSERIHAFLWQDGKMRDLGTLGGRRSVALAINERGQIVGWADIGTTDKNGKSIAHAVLWQNGTMIDLGTLGGQSSAAVAINEHGQIVGVSTSANGEQHAVLWTLKRG
jgi:probable HAF family extracellular repeat protein